MRKDSFEGPDTVFLVAGKLISVHALDSARYFMEELRFNGCVVSGSQTNTSDGFENFY